MAKKKTRRDTAEIARSVVEQAIGEKLTGEPLDEAVAPPTEENQAAVQPGRRGGLAGGQARAKKLSAEQRRQIAQKAARARWGKDDQAT